MGTDDDSRPPTLTGELESFVTNLFDPASDVDPSFTEASNLFQPVPPIVVTEPTTTSTLPTITSTGILGKDSVFNETCCDDSKSDLEYEQDLYFVLVVTTCSVTVLIAVSLAIYRLIESLLESGSNRRSRRRSRNRRSEGANPPQNAASNSPPARNSSIEFFSGFFPFSRNQNGSDPATGANSNNSLPRSGFFGGGGGRNKRNDAPPPGRGSSRRSQPA